MHRDSRNGKNVCRDKTITLESETDVYLYMIHLQQDASLCCLTILVDLVLSNHLWKQGWLGNACQQWDDCRGYKIPILSTLVLFI